MKRTDTIIIGGGQAGLAMSRCLTDEGIEHVVLERGRVAVSMLQREFSLDFKQATAVLDQLQEAGLIGPYMGGQRRDILLTLEEWRERRVGTS